MSCVNKMQWALCVYELWWQPLDTVANATSDFCLVPLIFIIEIDPYLFSKFITIL